MSAALLALLLTPFAGALGALLGARRSQALALAAAALAATVAIGLLAARSGPAATLSLGWVPALGLALGFRADRIALSAVLAIALVAGAGAVRSAARVEPGRERSEQLATLLGIAGLSQALALASNLAPLAALAALDALLLLVIEARGQPAGERARLALLLRLAGAWALLAAALLLRDATGTDALDALSEQAALVKSQPLFPLLVALLWSGALSRAATWPWSAWLIGGGRRSAAAGYAEPLLAITGLVLALRFAPLTAAWLPPPAVVAALALVSLAVAAAARALAPGAKGADGLPSSEPRR